MGTTASSSLNRGFSELNTQPATVTAASIAARARTSARLRLAPVGASGAQLLGDHERQIDGLLAVEARVAMRVIAAGEILLLHLRGAAQTLRHLLARHLYVHPARISALGRQDGRECAHFRQYAVERPRLVA